MNEDYVLKEKGAILNWFDIDAPEGRLSLNDKMADIMKTFRGKLILFGFFKKVMKGLRGGKGTGGFDVDKKAMMQMMGGFTLLRLTGLMGMTGVTFTKEDLLKINKKLNKIKKKK